MPQNLFNLINQLSVSEAPYWSTVLEQKANVRTETFNYVKMVTRP